MTRGRKTTATKTQFVLGLPNMSAKDVVSAGARARISLTEAYVYTIRYNDKNKREAKRALRSLPPRPPTKTGFVLGMPDVHPKDVVAAAKKAGLELTVPRVRVIRAQAKGKPPRRARPPTKTDFVLAMPDAPARAVVAAARKAGFRRITERHVQVIRSQAKTKSRRIAMGLAPRASEHRPGTELELRRAIAELGLARARQVLAEMEARFP